MLNLTSAALKVFLTLDPCDMRKSFNGLHTLAADQHPSGPTRDALFVFTNKRRNRIKLLYFDGTLPNASKKAASVGPRRANLASVKSNSTLKPYNFSSMALTSVELPSSHGMNAPID